MIQINKAPARRWYEQLKQKLAPYINNPKERSATAKRLLTHYLDYDATKHVLGTPLVVSSETLVQLNQAIEELKQHRPLQYITGRAYFYGHAFQVSPHVLIPRPETEEMVEKVIQEQRSDQPSILDIGTGSGCIAITLQKAFPKAKIDAVDIAPKALQVAQKNAGLLKADTISWHLLDFLHDSLPEKKWNVIISNPPYIPLSEYNYIEEKVVQHEPHQALFVPTENPLLFYHRIAEVTPTHLKKEGKIYLEVHAPLAEKVCALLQKKKFQHITLHQDMRGKKRFITALKPLP